MGKYETGEDRLLFSSVCELAAAFGRTLEQFVEEMKLPYSNLGGFREVEQDPYRPPASSSEAESAFSRPEGSWISRRLTIQKIGNVFRTITTRGRVSKLTQNFLLADRRIRRR